MAPIDAGVAFVPEDRDRDVGVSRPVLAQPCLAEDRRPARVAIFLARLRRLVLPLARDAPGLDFRLLGGGVALARRRDQARVDDLARHRDVPVNRLARTRGVACSPRIAVSKRANSALIAPAFVSRSRKDTLGFPELAHCCANVPLMRLNRASNASSVSAERAATRFARSLNRTSAGAL